MVGNTRKGLLVVRGQRDSERRREFETVRNIMVGRLGEKRRVTTADAYTFSDIDRALCDSTTMFYRTH